MSTQSYLEGDVVDLYEHTKRSASTATSKAVAAVSFTTHAKEPQTSPRVSFTTQKVAPPQLELQVAQQETPVKGVIQVDAEIQLTELDYNHEDAKSQEMIKQAKCVQEQFHTLHELQQEMAVQVHESGEAIAKTDTNTEAASDQLEIAGEQLDKAVESSRSINRKKCFLLALSIALVLAGGLMIFLYATDDTSFLLILGAACFIGAIVLWVIIARC